MADVQIKINNLKFSRGHKQREVEIVEPFDKIGQKKLKIFGNFSFIWQLQKRRSELSF